MNILVLGRGLEGRSAENYFKQDPSLAEHVKLDVLDNFKKEELLFKDFSGYDLIFRTPSIPPKFIPAPKEKITSVTKYFFAHCPAPIIGVTGTKGKGTTCTMIRDVFNSLVSGRGETGPFAGPKTWASAPERSKNGPSTASPKTKPNVWLVGNIGTPALDALPDIKPDDVVVYELSSFQLWDLGVSPAVAVVLRIEPDHLDVHESFSEYLEAKTNLVAHQSPDDFCIYFKDNKNTLKLVQHSPARKLPYPLDLSASPILARILDALTVPGAHNRENAEAALLASYSLLQKLAPQDPSLKTFDNFLKAHESALSSALANFQPLPHHIEFVRELNGVSYYDDSFSTVIPALEAAINSFSGTPLVLIVGGKDKGFDLEPAKRLIFDNPHLIKAVLIGETAEKLAANEDPAKIFRAGTDFELAIAKAREFAEQKLEDEEKNSDTCLVDAKPAIKSPAVLLSPCASSFDMFDSYKQRGDIFKNFVNNFH